jgi:hypothetical protein
MNFLLGPRTLPPDWVSLLNLGFADLVHIQCMLQEVLVTSATPRPPGSKEMGKPVKKGWSGGVSPCWGNCFRQVKLKCVGGVDTDMSRA